MSLLELCQWIQDTQVGTRINESVWVFPMLISGFLLFLPESLRWYHTTAFWIKMSLLLMAVLFHFTAYREVTETREPRPVVSRLCGATALLLWYAVALGGRALTIE